MPPTLSHVKPASHISHTTATSNILHVASHPIPHPISPIPYLASHISLLAPRISLPISSHGSPRVSLRIPHRIPHLTPRTSSRTPSHLASHPTPHLAARPSPHISHPAPPHTSFQTPPHIPSRISCRVWNSAMGPSHGSSPIPTPTSAKHHREAPWF